MNDAATSLPSRLTARTGGTRAYLWRGTDRQGISVRGEMQGHNGAHIKARLCHQGIRSITVRLRRLPWITLDKAISETDIVLFTRQLATMLRAGVPLLLALDLIAEGVDRPLMRQRVRELKQHIEAGNSLASSLHTQPQHFDDLYCSLIDAGEQAGALETLLERVATYTEKTRQLKARVKKAMTYPIAVLVVALIVSAILLVKVVPQFELLFAGIDAPLPALTRTVISLSEGLQRHGISGLISLVAGTWAFRYARRHSPRFRDGLERRLLSAPLIGPVLTKAAVARYARTLSTTFAAGVPLIQALSAVARAAGNEVFRQGIQDIRQTVSTGLPLSAAMRNSGLFPAMAIQMTAIGEESGTLDVMLEKVASHYEEEVDARVDNLTRLLEPVIMVVLGTLVGGLVVAMYLPIFQLGAAI